MTFDRICRLSIIPVFIIALLAAPLSARVNAAGCVTPAAAMPAGQSVFAKAYQDWRQTYVVEAGTNQLRVQRSAADNFDTVSEGVAYGMLFAAYNNDKATFDGLWNYEQAHLDPNGLMNWQIAANGTTIGFNAATDADEDMAVALIAADKQWGGYKAAATTQISLIKTYEVEVGTNVLKPGDVWGGSDMLDPSYLTPGYYEVFATYTGDATWKAVAATSYQIFEAIRTTTPAGQTGFIPDWSKADGSRTASMTYEYGYDASRAPLRLALSTNWQCNQTANSLLNALNATNKSLDLTKLASSYHLDGRVNNKGDGTPLLAAAASAAVTTDDSAYRSASWNALINAPATTYFSDSMRVFGLMVAGGSFVSPLELTSIVPMAAPAPEAVTPKSFSLSSTATSGTVGTPLTLTAAASSPRLLTGALVDLEVYDAQGNRVAQKFYEGQNLTTSDASYSVTFTPSAAGTYTLRGGIFTAGWVANMAWNSAISTITVTAPAPVQAPVVPVVTTSAPVVVTPPVITQPVSVVVPPVVVLPPVVTVPVVSEPVAPVLQPASPVLQPVAPVAVQTPATPVSTTPSLQSTSRISIWWPGNESGVHGVQPFKALLDNTDLSTYTMYWQVDNGSLNLLGNSYEGAAHKESLVDVSGWNWRGNQRYTVNFVAKNATGVVVAERAVVIVVAH